MRSLALLTAFLFATACGHKQPPASTAGNSAASTSDTTANDAKTKHGDHDEAAEHKGKPGDKDDDDDD